MLQYNGCAIVLMRCSVLPPWFVPLVLVALVVGWAAVLTTLVLMIRTRRAQRLAAEAREQGTT